MGTLTTKTALVIGGSRGVGRGIAEQLGRDGALVAVHYGHDDVTARAVVSSIEQAGGRAFAFRVELGVPGDAEALWAAFDEKIGIHSVRPGIDILVTNAGISVRDQAGEDLYDRAFAVNTKAPFLIIQHGLERLRDRGRIINVSPGIAKVAHPRMTAYAAAKGSLELLTVTLARALEPRGITVNSVSPSTIAADAAEVVTFLASADARWVTGQVVDASGGCDLPRPR